MRPKMVDQCIWCAFEAWNIEIMIFGADKNGMNNSGGKDHKLRLASKLKHYLY